MPVSVGTVLAERYRIDATLGQGGMGAVYRAWQLTLNRPVALKEMIPQPGIDAVSLAGRRQQFHQEATVLGQLDHAHLVRVIDFFEEAGSAYLVMELVEGESLAERVRRQGALSEREPLVLADQLLGALAYCHGHRVIHRDIKPENIILRPNGQAVLVDFGLVKLWDPRDPRTRTVMRGVGAPQYAPPEQLGTRPDHTDPRSDIYSLGATLYHALTGQAPMTASDRMSDPEQFDPPRQLNPRVSSRTEAAIRRAMELPRSRRFPSAGQMAAVFRGRALGPRRSVPRWVWAVVGMGVVGTGVGVLLILGWALVRGFIGGTEPPTLATDPPTLGDTWTRPADGMVMVYVPAGELEMGSRDDDADYALRLCEGLYDDCRREWFDTEQPAHGVSLDSF